ncbi:MAG: energy transducer TonB [Sphingobacteriales bacterium]|nr:MAG: energy transducer TonB [Sphingobacteriales bacterium]
MELQTLAHADYLDIVFDNRNKQYGGYELRKNYHLRMKKAGLSVALLCTLLCSYALWPKKHADLVVPIAINKPVTITICPIIEPVKIEPPKPATTQPAVKPTVSYTIPKIVDNSLVTDPPKTMDDLNGKDPGPVDAKGDANGTATATTPNQTGIGPGSETIPTLPATPPPAPVKWAEEMPQFNGDISAFMQRSLNYPHAARESGIEGSVVIQFVVNEDGSVTDAKVIRGIGGGCNDEALRVVRSMPKWKPGKQNGRAVKVFYTLPIRFVLQ